jgi:hypothetical protein
MSESDIGLPQTPPTNYQSNQMDSYESEGVFLASLPEPVFHSSLRSLMTHCGQYKGRDKLFHLAQNLLLNLGEFKGPEYERVVQKCVECLRRLPDPEGHIGDYATHVEKCCLTFWSEVESRM